MPTNCDNVLTVSASGDHPLFCKLYGAKHVTTFDITYNSKVLMDIKTVALQTLNISEYWQLLKDLRSERNTLSVPNMNKIFPKLSPVVQQYLLGVNGHKIFSKGLRPDSYLKYAPYPNEYAKMQALIQKPFDFIWSDIKELPLTKTYDFIHISNIFDYFDYKDVESTLTRIQKITNVGGRIFMKTHKGNPQIVCNNILKTSENWKQLAHGNTIVLQRVR